MVVSDHILGSVAALTTAPGGAGSAAQGPSGLRTVKEAHTGGPA